MGVVEMAERWQILLEPRVCHSFQLEENKSICEAATGAERTFWSRALVCACVRAHMSVCFARVFVGAISVSGWLV